MKKLLLVISFLAIISLSIPNLASAQIPFGGRIVVSIPCRFSGNWLVYIIPVTGPAQMIYRPGVSRLYQYGQIFRPGPQVLGTTIGLDVCVLSVVPPITIPAPMINMVGTSF